MPVLASLGRPDGTAATLPPALTVGAWLLADADADAGLAGPVAVGRSIGPEADPVELAADLLGLGTVGLLVMGDGSARRSERAPGYVDPRAEPFDAAVAAALAAGDAAALRALDPALGADLLAAGVPAWRVAGHAAAGVDLTAELLHRSAPYGVGYLVASWVPR